MKELAKSCRENPAYRRRFAELCRVFLKDGQARAVGESVDRSGIAATLETIAEAGADAFYGGQLGDRIVQEVQRRGGPLHKEDLAAYTVRTLEPLRGAFGPYEVIAMPPPSSGGAVILEVLNVLSARPGSIRDCVPNTSEGAHLLVEAMKHAFADRAALLGDRSEAVMADVKRMISPARSRAVLAGIDPDKTKPSQAYGLRAARTDGGTSHFCVVDAQGWAVACTETINTAFGSYVMVPGTGIILNNEMDDFAVDTKTPNEFGLRQSERNLIAPGRRPLSSMSPTIVLRDGKVVMIAGASGGPRIISATLQTMLNVLAGGMEVNEAVGAPRLHHQWLPDEVRAERDYPAEIVEGLRKRGHVVEASRGLGNVQAIHRRPNDWRAACDPPKGGKPAGH
jgi:gamma-glutamyltranspeptidase/glutathione hydrolase